MTSRMWFKPLVLSCLCAVMCAGCFGRNEVGDVPGGGPGGDDYLDIQDGDIEMGDFRTPDGIPVTDFEAQKVQFSYDSFQLADSEVRKIEAVSDYMGRNTDVHLVAEGHCDERGSRDYNMSLGEHRALAVRAYLVGLGIEGGRVQTRSYGEEQPLDPGHNESAWRLNRRVEFHLFRR